MSGRRHLHVDREPCKKPRETKESEKVIDTILVPTKVPPMSKKPIPGRPPLPPAERRSKTVKLSLTRIEYEAVARLAKLDDRPVASFLLRLIRSRCAEMT